ncbi:dihydrodipicolinate synthase family protein [Salinicoccus sp. Marseille-QA3877]
MYKSKFYEKLKTISGITVTPFNNDQEIDWQGVEDNVEYLVDKGLEVIVPCGNTSEFYALSIEEANEETKRTVEIVKKRAIVVAGVGYSVKTAIDMGLEAKKNGAEAIMIHMPVHPYITSEGAKNYFEEIIKGVDMPTVIYFKDSHLDDEILLELAYLDNFVGVKYAVNDLPRFAKAVEMLPEDSKVAMICGTAEKWAPFYFMAGAVGFTSGLVNVYPEKSFEMLNSLQNDDYSKAMKIWHEIVEFEDLREKYNSGNNVVVIKESMELIGLKAGPTRAPVAPLDSEDKESVYNLMKRWEFDPVSK